MDHRAGLSFREGKKDKQERIFNKTESELKGRELHG